MRQLETIEVETAPDPTGTVIWLHGLGADGHDFEPIVPQLTSPHERGLRFIFPHAPVRPVTINGGYAMRAWYDIIGLDRNSAQDEHGVRDSMSAVGALIERENARGIPAERIVLGGFSQGGAIALFAGTRYPLKLAGIMGLSCYLPLHASFAAERTAANQATPILLAHGTDDPVIDIWLGEETRRVLEKEGYAVDWRPYRMAHAVCPKEIDDIASWLKGVL